MNKTELKICASCMHKDLDVTEHPCCECSTAKDMWKSDRDPVNRPAHYTHGKYECIEVMEDCFGKEAVRHFCLLNAFKYIWRSEHKNGTEDIEKARWYLDKYLELEGDGNEKDG